MAAPMWGIFAIVIFFILHTRTYSHRPIILRFQEVNKNSMVKSSAYGFASIC